MMTMGESSVTDSDNEENSAEPKDKYPRLKFISGVNLN